MLEAKADVNAAKTDSVTSLYIASQKGHTDIVKLLLEAKADVNAADTDGVTSLYMASQNGHTDIVKLLLEAKANVNAACKTDGVTSLMMASQNGHTEIVKLLLEAKTDVNAARKTNGVTSLMKASLNGHTEIVKLLLEAKADVNAKMHMGGKDYTPLSIAKKMGHTEIVELLQKYGTTEFAQKQAVTTTARAKAPAGDHYTDHRHGFSLVCPGGWVFMTPEEVRKKTAGMMSPTSATLIFVVNESDYDKNINIQYTGDSSRDIPTNAAARRFFAEFKKEYPGMLRQKMPSARIVSSQVIGLASGVAFEAIFTSTRGKTQMKQKSVLLIVKGKAFTITCTSQEADFVEVDRNSFQPILKSMSFQ